MPTLNHDELPVCSGARLVEGQDSRVPYACLSHRWGSSNPLRLLKYNKADFAKVIPWQSVPQLFKDAMTVAIQLGLQHIWIDSLCIIQDDDTDWQIEAASMASIYKSAQLTIAASAARGSEERLFRRCSPMRLGKRLETSRGYTFTVRQRLQHNALRTPKEFPLRTRGWAFQEQFLSPRVAHFTHDELVWECRENRQCECGSHNPTGDYSLKNHFHKAVAANPVVFTHGRITSHWFEIVKRYSALDLTFHQDKLIAIAGVAQEIGSRYQAQLGHYLAGLWEKAQPSQLLWETNRLARRPFPKSAPTWSWASITTPINYRHDENEDYAPISKIIQIATIPVGPSPYGQIVSGSLTLRGPVLEGTVELKSPCMAAIFGRSFRIREDYTLGAQGEGDVEHGSKILLLAMSESRWYRRTYLVLYPMKEEKDLYELIGVIRIIGRGIGSDGGDERLKAKILFLDGHSFEKTVTIV